MKRRFAALALCVLMVAGVFCGCNASKEEVSAEVNAVVNKMDQWTITAKEGTSIYFYAMTDLDQNGKYEIISAENYGVGDYTESRMFELSEDGKTLTEIEHVYEGDSQVDLMQEKADVYKDTETGFYYYIFSDTAKDTYKKTYNTKVAISLQNGKFIEERLATESIIYEGESEEPVVTYYDSEGYEITLDDYMNAEANRFSGYEKLQATFGWKGYTYTNHDSVINSGNDGLQKIFQDSLSKFSVQ